MSDRLRARTLAGVNRAARQQAASSRAGTPNSGRFPSSRVIPAMTTKSWVITTGVRVHGFALARPTAKTANAAAVPMAISVRATPLARW